jgi:hypothetical protein
MRSFPDHPSTGNTLDIIAKPIQEKKSDPVMELKQCKTNDKSIMDCTHNPFGIVDKVTDCARGSGRVFITCDLKNQPFPFLAACDVGEMRFAIMSMKLRAPRCDFVCRLYGLGMNLSRLDNNAAVVDTVEKYDAVHKMIKKTEMEVTDSGNYIIGLRQCKFTGLSN